MAEKMRLHKFLARAGVGGRLQCESLIADGHVTVGGEVVTEMGFLVDPEKDEIRFEDRRLKLQPKITYAFNKPAGVVCTTSPDVRRPKVIDFFKDQPFRLYTAGRLEEDSEGLVLVTNDGDLAERVTHPRYRIAKTYLVRVRGRVERETIQAIRQGVWLAEGKTSPAHIRPHKIGREVSQLEITLFEGRNQEIQRLFARFGHHLVSLKRIRIGHLRLDKLPRGEFRRLDERDVEQLLDTTEPAAERGPREARGPRGPRRSPRGAGRPEDRPRRGPAAGPRRKKPRGRRPDQNSTS